MTIEEIEAKEAAALTEALDYWYAEIGSNCDCAEVFDGYELT